MALSTIAVNPIQQLALARGVNCLANPRYGVFTGMVPSTLFLERVWDNFKRGDWKYTASTVLQTTLPAIPGVNHWLFNKSTPTISPSVISAQATYTEFTIPVANMNGTGYTHQANISYEVGDVFKVSNSVTPNPTLDKIWKVTQVTPALPNQVVRAVLLGVPYVQPTNVSIVNTALQIYKHNQLVPTTSLTAPSIDYDYIFAGVSTPSYTFMGLTIPMNASSDVGTILYNQTDAGDIYARLRIPATSNNGRARLTTVDALEKRTGLYSGEGELDLGEAAWTFTATVRFAHSNSTEGWCIVGPHRSHNSTIAAISDEETRQVGFDQTLCFVAGIAITGDENWYVRISGRGPNQAAAYHKTIDTTFPSYLKSNLKITADQTNRVINFYINDTLVYQELNSPCIQVIIDSSNKAIYDADPQLQDDTTNESMWVGVELRGDSVPLASNIDLWVYDMRFTNNQAYLKTGLIIKKKIK